MTGRGRPKKIVPKTLVPETRSREELEKRYDEAHEELETIVISGMTALDRDGTPPKMSNRKHKALLAAKLVEMYGKGIEAKLAALRAEVEVLNRLIGDRDEEINRAGAGKVF